MEKNNEIPARIITPGVLGGKNVMVETYAEDMAKVLEDDKSGLIKKIILDEEKHEVEKRNFSPESKKNRVFMVIGTVLIALGLVTLGYLFLTRDVSKVPIMQQFTPLVFTDKSTLVEVKDFKKNEIEQTIFNTVNATEVKKGGVEGIYVTNGGKGVGLREFTALINSTLVLDNNPLFVSDNFLMGVVNSGPQPDLSPGKDFFILMKVRSADDIFNSMHAWEKKMLTDLQGFFGFKTTPETKYLLVKEFQDSIIENKNARILYDNDGKIVLMYIFADNNSVIVTNTESAAHEIMFRLAASQIKK